MLINGRTIREIADYDIQEEIVEPEAGLKLEEDKGKPSPLFTSLKALLQADATTSFVPFNLSPHYQSVFTKFIGLKGEFRFARSEPYRLFAKQPGT